ncbi:TIR domain-containing protein [uncultured Thiodictyon sp.]|jgi:hypothetical protein|uniref:TIR domain-containing protein n=1 Tax=uncultured Thiodictyon sp. TaxID=1846217 RepID=UPI0025F2BC8B|nr:TIR domain-containing protein [uncultured Thiodictyon sp.]
MTQIFISHSSKDLGFVLAYLKPILTDAGMLAWCSGTDLRAAADWEKQIRTALVQTDWFIVVLSPDAQQSEWVQSETHWALEHLRGRVIPVMARACDPYDLHIRLGTLQYIDFRVDPALAAVRLLALINGTGPDLEPKTRIPEPAAGLDRTTIISTVREADIRLFIELPNGPGGERRVQVRRCAIIGRGDDADLQLADDCVSRKHAKLTVVPGEPGVLLTLTDLESANGTFVNDRRVLSEQHLQVGDLISMGNARLRLLAIDETRPRI